MGLSYLKNVAVTLSYCWRDFSNRKPKFVSLCKVINFLLLKSIKKVSDLHHGVFFPNAASISHLRCIMNSTCLESLFINWLVFFFSQPVYTRGIVSKIQQDICQKQNDDVTSGQTSCKGAIISVSRLKHLNYPFN